MPIEPGVAEAGDSGEPFVTKEGEAAQDRPKGSPKDLKGHLTSREELGKLADAVVEAGSEVINGFQWVLCGFLASKCLSRVVSNWRSDT